jgi:uncharacterized protein (TIGR02147 family)
VTDSFDFYSVLDFRLILKQAYDYRRARRPSYSLSAFARDIGMSAPRLAGVLKGSFGISHEAAREIADKLRFSKEQKNFFCDLVESQHGRTKAQRNEASVRLLKYLDPTKDRTLSTVQFELLSHWYNLAAFELIKIHKGKITLDQIAKKLRISKDEAHSAIKSLLIHDQIKIETNGFSYISGFLTGTSAVPSKVIRQFHAQFLDKAKDAIRVEPLTKRKNRSSFLSFDQSKIEEARLCLETFHQDFVKKFSTQVGADRVYGFGVYLFPVDSANE